MAPSRGEDGLEPIIDQQEFDYTFLVSGNESVVLRDRVSLARAHTIGLSVRVHAIDIPGDVFAVVVYGVAPSDADGADFITGLLGSISLTGPAPRLVQLAVPIANVQAPAARVQLDVRSFGSGTIYTRLSIDMVLKTGD